MNLRTVSFALAACWLMTLSPLAAQDFEVAPVILEFSAEPGGIESKTISIRNHGNQKQSFLIQLGDQVVDEKGRKQNLPPGSTARSCANWLTLNPSFFELNPNESKEVEVLIQVPNDGFNTRWCMLYVKATTEQTASRVDKSVATGILVSPRIAVRVSQSPKSNTNYKASISNLVEVDRNAAGERTFSVRVQNVGDKMVKPKVYLILSNIQTAKEVTLDPQKTTLMPGEARIMQLSLPNDVEAGNYALGAIMDYGHDTDIEGVQMMIEIK